MKHIVVAVFLTMLWTVLPAQQKLQPNGPLSLTISPQLTKYVEGEPLPLRLTFKNAGRKRTTFTLPDKDEDPPGFIQARGWDSQGKLLTENDTLQDGWWTVQVLSSSFYKEKKSDRISLKPSEEYTRAIDLKRLLWGCRGLPEGLRVGLYQVQFSFGNVVSNKVEIRIEKPR